MHFISRYKYQIIIFLVSLAIFSVGLGQVHLFDWDEINFAESAREMIVANDYLNVRINFKPFWEKPPLFIWAQVLSMKIFGINEFAARFPNALMGAFTLLTLFLIGKKIKNEKFGLFWILTYVGSILPFFYFKSGIIDPWFNFFIFLGIYFFIKYTQKQNFVKNSILSGFFIGLAVLTKGPVGFLIFFLTIAVYFIIKKFKIKIRLKDIFVFSGVLIFTGGFWFILQLLNGNFHIIKDFIEYQIHLFKNRGAGHGGFPFYHFIVLFFGVFPASIFALKTFFKFNEKDSDFYEFNKFMKILFWVVLILFSIVKTKIIHYSSMCYYPLSFFAANILYKLNVDKIKWNKIYNILLLIIGILIGLAVLSLPIIDNFKNYFIKNELIKDDFVIGNLNANVDWNIMTYIIGIFVILSTISAVILNRKKFKYKGSFIIFATYLIFTFSAMYFIAPKIEKYTQWAAIEFYKKKSNENCYIEVLSFKSYAHLFYSNKKMPINKKSLNKNWLINCKTDKKVYFVTKNTKLKKILENYNNLNILYKKNGYVFLEKNRK